MKNRVLPLLLAVLLLFSACAQPASSSSSEAEPVDPYEYLLLPEGVKIGTSFAEAKELIKYTDEYEAEDGAIAYLTYYPWSSRTTGSERLKLGHYCEIFSIEYRFEAPKPWDEFENVSLLKEVNIVIHDTIKKQDRTKEKHGDIAAEFEVAEQFLIEHYGEPVKTDDRMGKLGYGYRSVWDIKEENMGIEMRVTEITSGDVHGEITLHYFSTEGYVDNWYDV